MSLDLEIMLMNLTKKKREKGGSYVKQRVRAKVRKKSLTGIYWSRYEWNYLGYRSPSHWMAEWSAAIEAAEAEEKEEPLKLLDKKDVNLNDLLGFLTKKRRKGRPRKKEKVELAPYEEQTAYGKKLLELERKYPVSRYYWNDGDDHDPNEIPVGDLNDIAELLDHLVS